MAFLASDIVFRSLLRVRLLDRIDRIKINGQDLDGDGSFPFPSTWGWHAHDFSMRMPESCRISEEFIVIVKFKNRVIVTVIMVS